MGAVFANCRATEGCARPDGHDDACNLPVVIRRRSPASQLCYWAEKLESGTSPVMVADALRRLAERV